MFSIFRCCSLAREAIQIHQNKHFKNYSSVHYVDLTQIAPVNICGPTSKAKHHNRSLFGSFSNSGIKIAMCPTSSEESSDRNIKAVLFDLDGTLLDTEALSDKAILSLFDNLPRSVLEEIERNEGKLDWECKKQILGLRATSWVPIVTAYAKENWGVDCPLTIDEFQIGWERNLNRFCEEIVACPGAAELVSKLSKVGIPMAIATSSRSLSVEKKRKRHENIFQHMSKVICGDDPDLHNGKPAPDIYVLAAERLGADPKDCLVFEDAMSGVRAGKAAGCYVVAVPDHRFSTEEKAEFSALADLVLDDLSQFDGSFFGIGLERFRDKS